MKDWIKTFHNLPHLAFVTLPFHHQISQMGCTFGKTPRKNSTWLVASQHGSEGAWSSAAAWVWHRHGAWPAAQPGWNLPNLTLNLEQHGRWIYRIISNTKQNWRICFVPGFSMVDVLGWLLTAGMAHSYLGVTLEVSNEMIRCYRMYSH